jgi:hypothetical protein
MAKAIGRSSSCSIVLDNGTVYDFNIVVDPTHGSNLLELQMFDKDGVQVATVIRCKGAGDAIAVDYPGGGPIVRDANGIPTNG